eukprot:scaffold346_cov347-Pavlova_lutheri.AAC.17
MLTRTDTVRLPCSPSKPWSSSCSPVGPHDHVRRPQTRHVRRRAWRSFVLGSTALCSTRVYEPVKRAGWFGGTRRLVPSPGPKDREDRIVDRMDCGTQASQVKAWGAE